MLLPNKPGCIVPDCCEAVQQSLSVVLMYDWGDLTDNPAILAEAPESLDYAGRRKWLAKQSDEAKQVTRFSLATPHWRIGTVLDFTAGHTLTGNDQWGQTRPDRPEFCPFCGTKLPDIERRPEDELPGPVHTPVADGDYCGTCDERSMGCTCWGPEVLWRTIPADEARRRALGRVVEAWEAENGPVTQAEIDAVTAEWEGAHRG